MCSETGGERKHLPAQCEDEIIRLERAFQRAHGAVRGEITTVSCAGSIVHRRNRPGRSHLRSRGA